jgi:hypothetical protein
VRREQKAAAKGARFGAHFTQMQRFPAEKLSQFPNDAQRTYRLFATLRFLIPEWQHRQLWAIAIFAVLLGRQHGNESKRFATSAEDDKYPEMTS